MVCRAGFENDPLEKMRHSAAHVLADAVVRLFPGAEPTIGPVIENGFFYDFYYPKGFTEEDLPRIEAEMQKIIKENLRFEEITLSRSEALDYLTKQGSKYKVEILNSIPESETLTFYRHGQFLDLCKGPHTDYSKRIKAFKLLSIAGAYWRGNSQNEMLYRIYGTAFSTQDELKAHLDQIEEAKKRDHRKLGKELEIFAFDDQVGPGMPLWLPNGGLLIELIEKLAKHVEEEAGYDRVRTPHLAKESLYLTSGHLPYYADSMYPGMALDGTTYYLKAMNCPHHHKIYASKMRSYRDLPIRFAEYGTCYRFEQSGELFGLMRVRSMQMNDAHIYCTLDQFETEFLGVINMYLKYFEIFGISKYQMRLSLHSKEGLGKKYVDHPELWLETEKRVRDVMLKANINFVEVQNEAAFYGPKIDVQVWSAIGREFTLATNQVDFDVPKRFGLTYKNSKNEDETPLCIHRAPLSTHERFIGFLLEQYAGAFPFWLAPEQVRILTIGESQLAMGHEIKIALKKAGYRVKLDERDEKLGFKIREAQLFKVPYMLVLGKKELENNEVSVRHRSKGDLGSMTYARFEELLALEDKPF